MFELLKKYLIAEWRIPLLLFGISSIIFLSGMIFPNTDFGFYLFTFSILLLITSSIWQIIKGKKIIGFALLSTSLTPIFALGFITYLFAGTVSKPAEELTMDGIESLIKEKTDLIITKNFIVLENLIEHTEGAFDSDYSIGLIIEYKETDEKYIIKQILKSAELESDKGFWREYDSGFNFENKHTDRYRAEPFNFKIDTINNKMKLNLTHL